VALLAGGCRPATLPVHPIVEPIPRMVLDVRCAASMQTDTVNVQAPGFSYTLLSGHRYPSAGAWCDDRAIRIRLTGFKPESKYMMALSAYSDRAVPPPQRVVVAGRLIRDQWPGDLMRVHFRGDLASGGRIDLDLEPELGMVTLTELHVVENPVSFPAGSVDLELCPGYSHMTADDALHNLTIEGPVTAIVDARQPVRRFKRVWEGVNGFASRISDLGTRVVRIQGADLFADAYVEQGIYRWQNVDRAVERVLAHGAVPLIYMNAAPAWLWPGRPAPQPAGGIGGVSSIWYPSRKPLRDLDAWAELVYQTVRHLNVERGYGIGYIEIPYDIVQGRFRRDTMQQYLRFYSLTARAVKRADRRVKVGGPAAGAYQPGLIEQFMERAADKHVPLDFVSWECYAVRPELYSRQIADVRQLARRVGLYPTPALVVDEWGYGTSAELHERLDSPFAASYSAEAIRRMDSDGFDMAFYSAAVDEPARGVASGLMRSDSTPKPVFALFRMLSFMGLHELDGECSGSGAGVGMLAGEGRSSGEVVVIVWWWLDDVPTAVGLVPVRFMVKNLSADDMYGWELYVIDDKSSNFAVGTDRADLTLVSTGQVPAGDSRFELATSLPLYGVHMLRLVPES